MPSLISNENSAHAQAGSPSIQQVGNLRYDFVHSLFLGATRASRAWSRRHAELTVRSNRVSCNSMKLAILRFDSDEVCARALKGLATRMRVTVLADESFIVPEAGVEWLKSENLPFQFLEWTSQDHVLQALRDNLAHPV